MANRILQLLRSSQLYASKEAAINAVKLLTGADGEIRLARYNAGAAGVKSLLCIYHASPNLPSETGSGWTFIEDASSSEGSSAALQAEVDKIESAVGLTEAGDYEKPTRTNYLDNTTSVMGALGALDTAVKTVDTKIDTTINGLDSSVAATDADGNQYSVLTGITETDGKLTAKTEVKLAAVAKTGAAADVTIADAGNKFNATNVEDALTELATSIKTSNTDNAVKLSEAAGSGDVLKVYTISQGGKSIGTINIPKDMVATSGQLVYGSMSGDTFTPAEGGSPYIKMTIGNGNTSNTFYIPVADLIKYNSVEPTAEVTLSEDANHKITATIAKIAAYKIDYTTGENGETVAQALERIDTALGKGGSVASQIQTAIQDLDADLDASGTPQHGGTFVMSGVTEVDGKLTAVDSVEVEAAGAAAAAKATIDNYTVNGKKISTNPTLYASDIAMSSDDSTTVAAAINAGLDQVNAGNGINVTDKTNKQQTISVKIDSNSNNMLTVGANGLNLSNVWDCGTYDE